MIKDNISRKRKLGKFGKLRKLGTEEILSAIFFMKIPLYDCCLKLKRKIEKKFDLNGFLTATNILNISNLNEIREIRANIPLCFLV